MKPVDINITYTRILSLICKILTVTYRHLPYLIIISQYSNDNYIIIYIFTYLYSNMMRI